MADLEMCCVPMVLPASQQVAAAQEAIRENPANRCPVEKLADLMAYQAPLGMTALMAPTLSDTVQIPGFLAVLTTKWWGAKGVDLTVGFMEATPADLRDRILSHANAWGEYANVRFRWTQTSPQVRISRESGGYYSYLGTDIKSIPANKNTMNLEGFTMQKPEAEFRRVVRHEFGHTLGFPHEHMRRELVSRLDAEKTIAWGARQLGWSAAMVRQQILTPLEESSLLGTEHADQDSLMAYQLPGSITTDGLPIRGGADFSPTDKQFVAKVYPKSAGPVEPPKPPTNGGSNVFGKILALIAALQAKDWLTAFKILLELATAIQAGQIPAEEVDQVQAAFAAAAPKAPKGK